MRIIFLVLIFAVRFAKTHSQDKWELAKDEAGIKVYVGEVANTRYLKLPGQ